MSKHYLIQVGSHTIFIDRIDGYGSLTPAMMSVEEKRFRFPLYLTNCTQLHVEGTEAQCVEEQAMLLERLESISDPEPEVDESHPQGQSG